MNTNNKKNKVAIIGTNGLPGRYGGWDQLLNHLTINLQHKFSFIVYTSSHNAEKGLKECNGAKLKIINLKANGMQSVFYDGISMLHAVFKYDILLVLGTSGCIFLPFIKLFNKKIILNPDGAEWKRGKWSKPVKAFLLLSEKIGIKYADVVIADNKVIQEYIAEEYKKPAELIAYGGDNAVAMPLSTEVRNRYQIEPNQYAFKVCRIEPENNINLILEAFKNNKLKFILIGNWNNSAYGKSVRENYKGVSNLILLDPIYDQQKLDELRSNCGVYIHGHSVGGTNPSLVEAMNLGLFCLVFDVSYNRETTENAALYFGSADELNKILKDFENNNIKINAYKTKMLEIAKRKYIWDKIVNQYEFVLTEKKKSW